MSDTMLSELSSLLGYDVTADSREMSEVFASTYEMQETYQEKEPYITAKTLVGDRYIWTESFINKVLYSLSTDDLSDMNTSEYQVMIGFIEFENRHSTSYTTAQETAGAIGCTVYDTDGKSYAVYESGISTKLCSAPLYDVPRDSAYKSLDNVLVYILNCKDWQKQDVLNGTLLDVSQCSI